MSYILNGLHYYSHLQRDLIFKNKNLLKIKNQGLYVIFCIFNNTIITELIHTQLKTIYNVECRCHMWVGGWLVYLLQCCILTLSLYSILYSEFNRLNRQLFIPLTRIQSMSRIVLNHPFFF